MTQKEKAKEIIDSISHHINLQHKICLKLAPIAYDDIVEIVTQQLDNIDNIGDHEWCDVNHVYANPEALYFFQQNLMRCVDCGGGECIRIEQRNTEIRIKWELNNEEEHNTECQHNAHINGHSLEVDDNDE